MENNKRKNKKKIENTKICIDCREIIKSNAKKCKYCGSYQGKINRFLDIIQIKFALILATVAVLTLLYTTFKTDKTEINIEFQKFTELQGNILPTVNVLIYNTGNQAGYINDISLYVTINDSVKKYEGFYYEPTDLHINPGTIHFVKISLPFAKISNKEKLSNVKLEYVFEILHYDGKIKSKNLVLTGIDLNGLF